MKMLNTIQKELQSLDHLLINTTGKILNFLQEKMTGISLKETTKTLLLTFYLQDLMNRE